MGNNVDGHDQRRTRLCRPGRDALLPVRPQRGPRSLRDHVLPLPRGLPRRRQVPRRRRRHGAGDPRPRHRQQRRHLRLGVAHAVVLLPRQGRPLLQARGQALGQVVAARHGRVRHPGLQHGAGAHHARVHRGLQRPRLAGPGRPVLFLPAQLLPAPLAPLHRRHPAVLAGGHGSRRRPDLLGPLEGSRAAWYRQQCVRVSLCGFHLVLVVLASRYADDSAEWELEPPDVWDYSDFQHIVLRVSGETLLQGSDQGGVEHHFGSLSAYLRYMCT